MEEVNTKHQTNIVLYVYSFVTLVFLCMACGRTKLCSQVWWCVPSAAILIFGGAQEVDELVLGCVAMRREARSLQHESKSLALGSGPAFRHDARDLGGQDSLALPGSCALAVSLCASTSPLDRVAA